MTNVYITVGGRFGQRSCDVREGGDVQDRVAFMDVVRWQMCWHAMSGAGTNGSRGK